jgi:hypothetical protein
VVTDAGRSELDTGRQLAGMTLDQLWLAYLALGGLAARDTLRRELSGSVPLSATEHDLIAHAINERFMDLGGDHPIEYRADQRTPRP